MMIKFENVNKYYNHHKKNEIHVIDNTSFCISENGLVALLGPSGCGKTTLLNVIGGLDYVKNGSIIVDGKKINGKSQRYIDKMRNAKIGYIFQNYNLVENMSVFDNVALSLKMIGIKDKEEIKKRVNYVLNSLGIYRYRKRPANMLSGGERQRVGIARALVKNPSIILADEPTGNLDSTNTIEIMNIIKSISKDRLVILVTHETELASFYADRIIKIEDGKILSDEKNISTDNLKYQIDNKIYLKDFKKNDIFKENNNKINVYSDNQKYNLTIIVKNNNIYIKTENSEKVEVIDNDSNIEIINDNYKEIDKSIYEKYSFDTSILKNDKIKYSSIIKPFKIFSEGIKKILDYTFVKKLLLLGFFASALFITYSVCNIFGIKKVDDTQVITGNKNYIIVKSGNLNYENYLEYQDEDFIDYLIPGDGKVTLVVKLKKYYQTKDAGLSISGTLTYLSKLDSQDLIYGRMPENDDEIVIDKFALENAFENSGYENKMAGYINIEDFINETVTMRQNQTLTIVGISDKKDPSIYVNENKIIDIINYSENVSSIWDVQDEYYDESGLYNYENHNITLKKGHLPENIYEIIVSEDYSYEYPLNKTIDQKVNGHKLKVVGYFKGYYDLKYTNKETITANIIYKNNKILVMPKDKEETLSFFMLNNMQAYNVFDKDLSMYNESRAVTVRSGVIASIVVLVISFVEIYLIIRSSFLSRIKEIGIYRAIGVKKIDIYRMFLGEILAITTIACIPGALFMAYCLNALSDISYIASNYLVNPFTVIFSIVIIYIFNIIVGLLPVAFVIKDKPAIILSRKDLD